jgi:hypothetical protein
LSHAADPSLSKGLDLPRDAVNYRPISNRLTEQQGRFRSILRATLWSVFQRRLHGEKEDRYAETECGLHAAGDPRASLAEVVGAKPIPRTEVTKKLWAYIKKNGLQDKKNRRMINADDNLKVVFGGKASVNMFAMTKLVSKHLK